MRSSILILQLNAFKDTNKKMVKAGYTEGLHKKKILNHMAIGEATKLVIMLCTQLTFLCLERF